MSGMAKKDPFLKAICIICVEPRECILLYFYLRRISANIGNIYFQTECGQRSSSSFHHQKSTKQQPTNSKPQQSQSQHPTIRAKPTI